MNNATAAVQEIKKLAGQHDISISQLNVEDKQAGMNSLVSAGAAGNANFSRVSVGLDVSGHFQKLIRWMNALENSPGFQTGHWYMTPSSERPDEDFLSIGVDILLVNS